MDANQFIEAKEEAAQSPEVINPIKDFINPPDAEEIRERREREEHAAWKKLQRRVDLAHAAAQLATAIKAIDGGDPISETLRRGFLRELHAINAELQGLRGE